MTTYVDSTLHIPGSPSSLPTSSEARKQAVALSWTVNVHMYSHFNFSNFHNIIPTAIKFPQTKYRYSGMNAGNFNQVRQT